MSSTKVDQSGVRTTPGVVEVYEIACSLVIAITSDCRVSIFYFLYLHQRLILNIVTRENLR